MSFSTESQTESARLTEEIKRGTKIISLSGLTSIAAKAFILSELKRATDKNFIIVTDSNKDSDTFECDLNFFQSQFTGGQSQIFTLPSFESDIYANVSPHAETQEKRALALWNLTRNAPDFLIVSAKSLIMKTFAPDEIRNLGAHLKRDEDFAPEMLIEKLAASGYVREEPLRNVGEFSVRGGILDVWSPDADMPVRIEFFGDTVDSIRQFDVETQLSTEQLKETSIAPMREFAATAKDFRDWSFFARERFSDEKYARAVADRTQFADEGEDFSGWEFLFPLAQPRQSSVFEFLENYVLVVDEPALVEQTLAVFYETLDNRFAEITEAGEIGLEPNELFLSGEDLRGKFENAQRR
jgi:transcription-repair coupling factor (superfamily II helicase)